MLYKNMETAEENERKLTGTELRINPVAVGIIAPPQNNNNQINEMIT